MNETVTRLKNALLDLDRLKVEAILNDFNSEHSSLQCAEEIVGPALEQIGTEWQDGRVSLAQVFMTSRICDEMVDTFLPPADPLRKDMPRMAIAAFQDHHVLGKRIVQATLRASGYEVLDYGAGVTTDQLITHIKEDRLEILLLSVLMLPSALHVREVTDRIKEEGLQTRVIVGGAPFRFDSQLWQEVGADAMGVNAVDAVTLVSQMREGSL